MYGGNHFICEYIKAEHFQLPAVIITGGHTLNALPNDRLNH